MRDLTIPERLAWIHRDATTLASSDLVELKGCLKNLIEQATAAHDLVKVELQAQRVRENHVRQNA